VALNIGVIGDYDADRPTHRATDAAIGHVADRRGWTVETKWISTPMAEGNADQVLWDFDGLWIAPGSPYECLQGALDSIEYARRSGIPLLGTCGGFQHVVIEFAQHVAGLVDAAHAEYDANALRLVVTPLTCPVAGRVCEVLIEPGTVAHSAYRSTTASEHYRCSFGLNSDYVPLLREAGLVVSGTDETGEVRVIELPRQPFFLATLFVPQLSSSPDNPHPLVAALLAAALDRAGTGQ
jgi:CTP synthase (UTP-ammonia lyase)